MKFKDIVFIGLLLLNIVLVPAARAQDNSSVRDKGDDKHAQQVPQQRENDGDERVFNNYENDQEGDRREKERSSSISKLITQELAAAVDPEYAKLLQQEKANTKTMMKNWDKAMVDFEPSDAFNFEVSAGQFEMFYEDIKYLPSQIRGVYFVSSSQNQDVDFQIIDPKKKVIFKRKKEKEGVFHFDAQSHGVYGFAFNNRKGNDNMVVTFAIHVANATGAYVQKADVDPLESQLSHIETNLLEVYTVTRIASRRQETHYRTSLSNHDDIITWFAIETLVIIGTLLWEAYFIKKLLSNQRII